MSNPILDLLRGSSQTAQPQINQQAAQSQWQRFLSQYGNINPQSVMDQMVRSGEITPQQRDLCFSMAKMLSGLFRL